MRSVDEVPLDQVDLADLAPVDRHPEGAYLVPAEGGLDRPPQDGQYEPDPSRPAGALHRAHDQVGGASAVRTALDRGHHHLAAAVGQVALFGGQRAAVEAFQHRPHRRTQFGGPTAQSRRTPVTPMRHEEIAEGLDTLVLV